MEQRITFITLGVGDLKKSVDFYENKFGWRRSTLSMGDFKLYELNGIYLGLYPKNELAKDATVSPEGEGFKQFVFSYATKNQEEVDDLIEELEENNVRIVKRPQKVFWGGYSSYVADPDGNLWEILYNPYLKNK